MRIRDYISIVSKLFLFSVKLPWPINIKYVIKLIKKYHEKVLHKYVHSFIHNTDSFFCSFIRKPNKLKSQE